MKLMLWIFLNRPFLTKDLKALQVGSVESD